MRNLLAGLILVLGLAGPSAAQIQRALPANAKLGTLVGQQQQYPLVQIDTSVVRLAPGAVIVDENNRFILHGYLPAQATILYLVDNQGAVTRIVILRPDELARLQQAGVR